MYFVSLFFLFFWGGGQFNFFDCTFKIHSLSICPVGLVVATLTPQVLSPFTQLQNELILINQLFSSNLNIGLTGVKRTFMVFDILAPCIELHKNDWVTPFLRILKSQFWILLTALMMFVRMAVMQQAPGKWSLAVWHLQYRAPRRQQLNSRNKGYNTLLFSVHGVCSTEQNCYYVVYYVVY